MRDHGGLLESAHVVSFLTNVLSSKLRLRLSSFLDFSFYSQVPMALHAPLTQFLTRLDADLGAGAGAEFLSATGRHLVAGHVIPEEDFSRAGQPSDSDLGSLLRTLHSLGAQVDWTSAATAGHACKRLVRCILLLWLTIISGTA